MFLAAPAPVRRSLADLVVEHLARALVATGIRLRSAHAARRRRRADRAATRRARGVHQHIAAERMRDNTAQINPLTLR